MGAVESIDARGGGPRGVSFPEAAAADVEAAAAAAAAAAPALAALSPAAVAAFLRDVADRIVGLGDELLEVADAESALGLPRLTGERARTAWQLEAFARLVESGEHLDAVIDPRDPDATPVARPDLRRVQVPVGPVAVFAASNFPLAFSVAGGDSAAAFAAGCPVVVKAHPSHPATSELVAGAIRGAVEAAGLPAGTFSLLHGAGPEVGVALVEAEPIEAVGFTGSLRAGRALFDAAAARPRPIPVYAEMGSTNPMFVTAAALEARGDAIAEGLAGSFTLGVGQFCTKPGLVFVGGEQAAEELAAALGSKVGGATALPMLNDRLQSTLADQLDRTTKVAGVRVIAGASPSSEARGAAPVVLSVDLPTLEESPEVGEEHFGPVVVVVSCPHDGSLVDAARGLRGNLTATVHAEPSDNRWSSEIAAVLQTKVGRIVWNGYPTGVAVTDAMVHGGPYPATTAAGTTSVGLAAIRRFLRPVAFQEAPDDVLPPALRDANPLGLRRKVDGSWTDGPVVR
jgi:alpha-ketoglutaric semialdehyde dehydrogenase